MPAQAGIQWYYNKILNLRLWIPAFVGMTTGESDF